ncbi:MAG: flavin reductase family protein [Lachnospiraceae bacterium]
MAKKEWPAGNMLYPLPVVMVSVRDKNGKDNIITVAWAGTICSNPPMVSISVRPERYSHKILKETGEFVINLTTQNLARATDFCGVRSGKDIDKFAEMRLEKEEAQHISAAMIKQSPVSIECKVEQTWQAGSHDVFMAKVLAVHVDEEYLNDKNKFELNKANPIVYSHGEYYLLGKQIGTFGYSVRKKNRGKAANRNKAKGPRK